MSDPSRRRPAKTPGRLSTTTSSSKNPDPRPVPPINETFSPEVRWDNQDFVRQNENVRRQRQQLQQQQQQNTMAPSRGPTGQPSANNNAAAGPTSAPGAQATSPSAPRPAATSIPPNTSNNNNDDDDTTENTVWPTRSIGSGRVAMYISTETLQEFEAIPPGWSVDFTEVLEPTAPNLPHGDNLVEFDVPGRGTFYLDGNDTIFSSAPSWIPILRNGVVVEQDPEPEPEQEQDTLASLANDSVWNPNGPNVDPDASVNQADPVQDTTSTDPDATADPADDSWWDPENSNDGDPYASVWIPDAAEGDFSPTLYALQPILTRYGVRYRDRNGDELVDPGDREVDVSDRAAPGAIPSDRVIGRFIYRDRIYYIDMKHRIYITRPQGCTIPIWSQQPQASPPRPAKTPARRPFRVPPEFYGSPVRNTPKIVTPAQMTPLKQVQNARARSPSPWLAPSVDLSFREIGHMVRKARRILNDDSLADESFAARQQRVQGLTFSPGTRQTRRQDVTLAREALQRIEARVQRIREEPEERRPQLQRDDQPPHSPPQGASGAPPAAPAARPATGSSTGAGSSGRQQGSSGSKQRSSGGSRQATESASGNRDPGPVKMVDAVVQAATRPVTKTRPAPSSSFPAAPPAARPTASSLPQSQTNTPPTTSSSSKTPQPSNTTAAAPADDLPTSSVPGFWVRTAQEPRRGRRQLWDDEEHEFNHTRYLNEAANQIFRRDWFDDQHFIACLRLAIQRPLSLLTTQPRPFVLNIPLAEQLSGIDLGREVGVRLAFQSAELRIIPINVGRMRRPAQQQALQDIGLEQLASGEIQMDFSGGAHWTVAMEFRNTLYYFDTFRATRNFRFPDVLRWYQRLRTSAGVTDELRTAIVDVNFQSSDWECGMLAVELVRRVIQEHNGDPSAVTSWGRRSYDVRNMWLQAIRVELGGDYVVPTPARTTRARSGRSSAMRFSARFAPQTSRQILDPRYAYAHMRSPIPFSPTSSRQILPDHTERDDAPLLGLKRVREEVEIDSDEEMEPARKVIRRMEWPF